MLNSQSVDPGSIPGNSYILTRNIFLRIIVANPVEDQLLYWIAYSGFFFKIRHQVENSYMMGEDFSRPLVIEKIRFRRLSGLVRLRGGYT